MILSVGYGICAIVLAGVYGTIFARLAAFRRRFPTLREWEGPSPPTWPKVSVIVPCRNEEAGVEKAMLSLLAQDYPELQILAVDDRSEDATGAVLDALAARDPRLTVLHIATLPDGWLGKNHAMRQGAARADGSWLLFTDGDVMFEPGALKRSVAFAKAHGLGHFIALPRFVADGFLERAFVSTFMISFSVLDPTRLHVAKSWSFVGVGAFGLVRRDAYERIGGHERLAFEVADDVKLGLLLRRGGVAQGCLDSDGMVSVRWQNGFLASLRGLEKNAFAALEWDPVAAVLGISAFLGATLLPYAPLVFTLPIWTWPFAAFCAFVQVLLVSAASRHSASGTGLEGLLAPFMALSLAGVITWSTMLALARGGIVWRGTFYPLARLRQHCVRVLSLKAENGVGWTPPTRPRR